MSLKLKKVLRVISKVVLILVGICIFLYFGFRVFLSIYFEPHDVRLTNITDSSMSISWITNYPMKGVVYYKDSDSFLPNPFTWLNSKKGADDRDYSNSQKRCVDDFNEKANVNEDFVMDMSDYDCENITVNRTGNYFTHHVTLKSLNSNTEYFFRVGDGLFSYKMDLNSSFTLSSVNNEVKSPAPIFGTVISDKNVTTDDSMVYVQFKNNFSGQDSIYYSSPTSYLGGWYLDSNNLRTIDGDIMSVEQNQDGIVVHAQYENYELSDANEWIYAVTNIGYPDIVVSTEREDSASSNDIVMKAFARIPETNSTSKSQPTKTSSTSTSQPTKTSSTSSSQPTKTSTSNSTSGGGSNKSSFFSSVGNAITGAATKIGNTIVNTATKIVNTVVIQEQKNEELEKEVSDFVKDRQAEKSSQSSSTIAIANNTNEYIQDIQKIVVADKVKEAAKESVKRASPTAEESEIVEKESVKNESPTAEEFEIEAKESVKRASPTAEESEIVAKEVAKKNAERSNNASGDRYKAAMEKYEEEIAKESVKRASPTAEESEIVAKENAERSNKASGDRYKAAMKKYEEEIAKKEAQNESYENVEASRNLQIYLSLYNSSIKKNDSGGYVLPSYLNQGYSTKRDEQEDGTFIEIKEPNNSLIKELISDDISEEKRKLLINEVGYTNALVEYARYKNEGIIDKTVFEALYLPYNSSNVNIVLKAFNNKSGTFTAEDLKKGESIYIDVDTGSSVLLDSENKIVIPQSSLNKEYEILGNGGTKILDNATFKKYSIKYLNDNNTLELLRKNGGERCPVTDVGCVGVVNGYSVSASHYLGVVGEMIENKEYKNMSKIEVDSLVDTIEFMTRTLEGKRDSVAQQEIKLNDNFIISVDTDNKRYVIDCISLETETYNANDIFSYEYLEYIAENKYVDGIDERIAINDIDGLAELINKPSEDGLTLSIDEIGTQLYEENISLSFIDDLKSTPIEESTPGEENSQRLNNILINKSLVRKVSAAEEEEKSYIFFLPDYGYYDVEIGTLNTTKRLEGGTNVYSFYIETNGEEGFQAPEDPSNPTTDEDLVINPSILKISYDKVASANTLTLKKGINMISFNYMPLIDEDESTKASSLFNWLLENDVKIENMSFFEGGRWKGLALVDNEPVGEDFTIVPGRGYLLFVSENSEVGIPGNKITSSVPVNLYNGWNLVGINGYSNAFTAGSLMRSINEIDGLKVNNVSYWSIPKGKYEGLQITNEQEYGLDFAIDPQTGYFIRVNEFEPKDSECKSIIWQYEGTGNGTCGTSKSI